MSRKLSSLLYTSGEDLDWNEMVGEDKEEEEEEEEEGEDQGKSDDHRSRGDSTGDREVGSSQTKKATPPPPGLDTTQVSSFYFFTADGVLETGESIKVRGLDGGSMKLRWKKK